jgi:hypothetical protein
MGTSATVLASSTTTMSLTSAGRPATTAAMLPDALYAGMTTAIRGVKD